MRPRRPSLARNRRLFAYALQRHRLELVATGRAEPRCEREQLFLWSMQARHVVTYADFILPWPLLLAEQAQLRLDAGQPLGSGYDAFSPAS